TGGTIYFSNRNLGVGLDAPVFDTDGVTRLSGEAFVAQLWAGPNADALAPIGEPLAFRTGDGAGYFFSEIRSIPTVSPGATAFAQIRAWQRSAGATFEAAVANRGKYGMSKTVSNPTGNVGSPPSLPTYLLGLASFKLGTAPVEFALERIVEQGGSIVANPDRATYAAGTVVTLTANADSGYVFSGWARDLSGTQNPTTVTMSTAKQVEAVFRATAGTLFFSNRNLGVGLDAPVFDTDGVTRLSGDAFVAQLWAGPTADTLAPIGEPLAFRTGDGAGYFFSEIRSIPTVAPGNIAYAQVRAWERAAGATFEDAASSNGKHGYSAIVANATGNVGSPPSLPTYLLGLASFKLSTAPAQFTLTRVVAEGGHIEADPDQQRYPVDTVVPVKAVADPGYEFITWLGDLTGTTNPQSVIMNREKRIEALFRATGGTVYFVNRNLGAGIDAPIFDADGITRLAGDAYVAQLYAGPTETTLAPIGAPSSFRTGDGAGYFFGATRSIPTVSPGQTAYTQVRAWKRSDGDTFEAAGDANGKRGYSVILAIPTGNAGNPPSLPTYLKGLTSFKLSVDALPTVAVLSPPVPVQAGERAQLLVSATGTKPLKYQWYEGDPGDISKPVGTDSATFQSEPLWASTTFWVRVSNPLGKADSGALPVTVVRRPQTIAFNALPPVPYGIEPFQLTATASSGLPVTFSVDSGPGNVDGNRLTIAGAGTIVIRASQAGNNIYHPANPVTQSLVVKKAGATITLTRLHQVFDGAPKSPEVRVVPSGLEVQLTFDGSPNVPTGPGEYQVVATVVDLNYFGTTRAEFEIKAGVNLAGSVFNDLDSDGLPGSGEAGMPDVLVRLLALDGNTELRAEKTDATGAFGFKALPAGTYYVRAENPSGYVSTTPELQLVRVATDTVATVGFGKQAAGTVSGIVFEDLDADGQRDDGEKGLEGVTVELTAPNVSRSTETKSDGTYAFANVNPGSYSVEAYDLMGYVSTTPNTRTISLAAGGAAKANFGDRPSSQVSGLVFLDTNGNGSHDGGEPGLADVNVRLSGPDGLQSRTTDANGLFLFEETIGGVYTIEEIDPVGYTSTTPNLRTLTLADGDSIRVTFGDQAVGRVAGLVFDDRNGNGSADSGEPGIPDVTLRLSNGSGQQTALTESSGAYVFLDVAPGTYTLEETDLVGFLSTTPNTRTITVASGGSASMNFGDQAVGTVSGSVFVDSDGNGTRESSESGIGGVTVRLIGSNGQRSTVTAGDGSYRFTAVVAGAYQVEETDPIGYVSTTANSRAVSVANGGSANADFGDLAVGSVTGTVFEDLNGDGSRDAGEPGLGGVTVVLVGRSIQRSTTTAGDGTYQFGAVAPGTYSVEETDPIGFSSTTPNLRTINVASAGAASANFGDQAAGTIGGIVFDDLNGNGIQETGEPGLGGVDVKLLGTSGQRNAVTSGNGSYLFTGVDPGAYTLEETDPAGFSSTTPNLRTLILTSGAAVTANFGDQAVGSVAGIVFADANGNGIREPEESGIGGVSIRLTGSDGQRSTTTSGDGTYQFGGLNPGSYTIEETDPVDFVSTTPNLRAVSLASGGSASASFGDQAVKTISGLVFEDQDHDGAYDTGEPGIGGVSLQLLRADDESVVRETITSGTGSFVFADVPAGDYIVRQTVPDAYTIATLPLPPSVPSRHAVGPAPSYANKEVTLAANGAAAVNFGVSVTGQLIGVVFNDLDGDGDRTSDEPGLGGVTLEVRHPQTGNLVASTVTSGSGVYLFASLPVGDYQVVQKPLTGYIAAQPSRLVALAMGGAAGANFANQAAGTVSGRVFNDEDGDGELDATEPGMGGVPITLTSTSGTTRQVTTSGDGTFLFTGVLAGTVNLTQSTPSGFTATTPVTVTMLVATESAASASFGNQSDNLKPPTITSEPGDLALAAGATATLSVTAEGTNPMTYQWLKDGTPLPNATNSILTLSGVQASDAAGYQARVRNAVGTMLSRIARVTVSAADPYNAWAATQGLPAQAKQPEDDPDNDGLPNLLEFALGSSPTAATDDHLPVLILTAQGDDQWLGFEIQRPRAAAGVRLVLQASTDLKTWSTVSATVTVVQTGASADTVRVTDPTPVSDHPYRFLRLGAASSSANAAPATLTMLEETPIASGTRMALAGTPGSTYLVEWSTDLITWHTLQEVIATETPLIIVDTDSDTSTYRFYRANAR
ncbi:MAG: carboxypeptidase regulatory-like domain-containing protein, partial [Verrucomicrobiales bacterium]|nr:carboxypeptidase regulatory-like domain-containing protein [Verrucomicrobiales bacterium]